MNEEQIKRLLKSTYDLGRDIDNCIIKLIYYRSISNKEEEYIAHSHMESLMVATMQQLDCLTDTIKELTKSK